MLAAAPPSMTSIVFMAVIVVGVLLGLAYLLLKGFRRFRAAATLAAGRAFDGVACFSTPGAGLVEVVFHAYSGIIVFTTQVEYHFWAKPEDAKLILKRLHHFNMTWGFFGHGGLIIPLLSLANYRGQLRRIDSQVSNVPSL